MLRVQSSILCLLVLGIGCSKPPQAPKRLNKLCGYLFAHVWDEQPTELQAGLSNLRDWLEHKMEKTQEGYTISELSQEQVGRLDSCSRDIDGLIGAAVASHSSHDIEETVHVLVEVPATQVYETTNYSKRFNFRPDRECFIEQECDRVRYETATEQDFPLGLEVRSLNTLQHRWVQTEAGTAHLYRTWLQEPADTNWNWLDVQSQFYVSAIIPWKGGTVRLQATWAVTELGGGHVPEGTALNKAIKTMQDTDADVQAYLNRH